MTIIVIQGIQTSFFLFDRHRRRRQRETGSVRQLLRGRHIRNATRQRSHGGRRRFRDRRRKIEKNLLHVSRGRRGRQVSSVDFLFKTVFQVGALFL